MMAGPWEKYASADQSGPWSKYASADSARQIDPQKRAAAMGELKGRIEAPKSMLSGARQAIGASVENIAQGLTLGASDEILAGLQTPIEMASGAMSGEDSGKGILDRISSAYSRGLASERGQLTESRRRNPVASAVGELAGGMVTGGGLAKGGVTLLNAARPTYASMIGRGAAEGAGYGAVYGFNTGEGVDDRLSKAATGATVGAATGGVVGAAGARSASRAASAGMPTAEQLKAASTAAYDRAEQAGVLIDKGRIDRMVADLQARLANEGADATLHSGVIAAFNRLKAESGNHVTFKGMDILRRVANSAGRSLNNPDEGRLAGHIVDSIDDVMNNLRPVDVISGDPRAASTAIVEGRELWKRMRKTELLDELLTRAEDRVAANYTAAGMQTAIRQELRTLLNNKRNIRGFSKAEKDMMRAVVRGSSVENLMRHLGKFAPRGVVGATLGGGAGYAVGGPAGAAVVWGVGEGAKQISATMTATRMRNLVEAVRNGGPRVLKSLPGVERQFIEAVLAGATPIPIEMAAATQAGMPSNMRSQAQ
ncbi:MAG: hypothetical protein WAT93_02860 [Pontixanthobacter sp.]